MRYLPALMGLLLAFLLTWLTTPDMTDNSIPFEPTKLVLQFGVTFVLGFLLVDMLSRRLRKPKTDVPTLDLE